MRAVQALSIVMACSFAVAAILLLIEKQLSLFTLGLMLPAPAFAFLALMLLLRTIQCTDCPKTFGESTLVAILHTAATATAASLLATAFPTLAVDVNTTMAFHWTKFSAWSPLLLTECLLVPITLRG